MAVNIQGVLSDGVKNKLYQAMQNAQSTSKEEEAVRTAKDAQSRLEQEYDSIQNSNATTDSKIKLAEIEQNTAKVKERQYLNEDKAFRKRMGYERELIKEKYASSPKQMQAQLKMLDARFKKESAYYAMRRKEAAFETRQATSNLAVLRKRDMIEKDFLKRQGMAINLSKEEVKRKKEDLDLAKKSNEQLTKNVRDSKQLVDIRKQMGFRTPLGQFVNGKTSAWAIDEKTGATSSGKTAAGLAGASAAEIAGRAPSQAIGAMSSGLSSGVNGVAMDIASAIGDNASLLMGATGGALGALAGPEGAALGGALGGAIGAVASDLIKFDMQASLMKVAWGRIAAKQGTMSAMVGGGSLVRSNDATGLMLPHMSIDETTNAIKSGTSFGINPTSDINSPFMQLAALNKVYDDVSAQMADMVDAYDDQSKAILEVDKAFGFGRESAEKLGTSVDNAAKQMSVASKMARFTGIDANIAQGLVATLSDRIKSLRNVGIDADNLGQSVGGLLNAPKNMSMAMQYYVASNQGKDKSMTPLKAAFMANYGSVDDFKYDKDSGVASFGKTKDPLFLRNLKKIQMQYIEQFSKAFGSDYAGTEMARQLFGSQFGMNKEGFDLLLSTGAGDIGKGFSSKMEKVTSNPMSYLTHLESMDSINNHMQATLVNISESLGSNSTDRIVSALISGTGTVMMSKNEKAITNANRARDLRSFNANNGDKDIFSVRNMGADQAKFSAYRFTKQNGSNLEYLNGGNIYNGSLNQAQVVSPNSGTSVKVIKDGNKTTVELVEKNKSTGVRH